MDTNFTDKKVAELKAYFRTMLKPNKDGIHVIGYLALGEMLDIYLTDEIKRKMKRIAVSMIKEGIEIKTQPRFGFQRTK